MDILQKRIDSLKEAIDIKDENIIKLQKSNFILESEKKQYIQMKAIQEQIIQNALDKANILNNQYLEEIQELKRKLENGDSS